MQQNAYQQGGMLRSRDMAMGRGILGSALGEKRQQDQARIGQANELGQANQDMNDKYSLGMGAAGVALGSVGNQQNQQNLNWYQGGMRPIDAQSEAYQQQQRWASDAKKQADSANP